MAIISSFRDLEVYKLAFNEAKKIFELSQSFPKEELYSLTDQIKRYSRAVNALIAESWARRKYKSAFINKINEALGEAMETQAWLDHAYACEYLTAKDYRELDKVWQQIGAMLNRMIQRADNFCRNSIK